MAWSLPSRPAIIGFITLLGLAYAWYDIGVEDEDGEGSGGVHIGSVVGGIGALLTLILAAAQFFFHAGDIAPPPTAEKLRAQQLTERRQHMRQVGEILSQKYSAERTLYITRPKSGQEDVIKANRKGLVAGGVKALTIRSVEIKTRTPQSASGGSFQVSSGADIARPASDNQVPGIAAKFPTVTLVLIGAQMDNDAMEALVAIWAEHTPPKIVLMNLNTVQAAAWIRDGKADALLTYLPPPPVDGTGEPPASIKGAVIADKYMMVDKENIGAMAKTYPHLFR